MPAYCPYRLPSGNAGVQASFIRDVLQNTRISPALCWLPAWCACRGFAIATFLHLPFLVCGAHCRHPRNVQIEQLYSSRSLLYKRTLCEINYLRFRWALLAPASALLARDVYAERSLKEYTQKISVFISAVAPCAQLSYRYTFAHLRTVPMHGIGSKTEKSAYCASCPSNDACQRRHFRFSCTTINLNPLRTPRMDPLHAFTRPFSASKKRGERKKTKCKMRPHSHNIWQ